MAAMCFEPVEGRASTGSALMCSPAGNRRNDRDLGAFGNLGIQTPDETHIVISDLDVDESTQRTGIVEDPRADAGVIVFQGIQDLGQSAAVSAYLAYAACVGAQDGGDADGGTHEFVAFQKSMNAS